MSSEFSSITTYFLSNNRCLLALFIIEFANLYIPNLLAAIISSVTVVWATKHTNAGIITEIKFCTEQPEGLFCLIYFNCLILYLYTWYIPSTMKNILTITRIHFIAPDGYLQIVIGDSLHEVGIGWMRNEFGLWIGYCLLIMIPNTLLLLANTLKGIFLCFAVWNFLVYTNNEIEYGNFVGAFMSSKKTLDISYCSYIEGVPTEFPTIILEAG